MISRFSRIAFRTFLLGCTFFFLAPLNAENRPNIIIVMVDDMGWSDLGCYGGEIQTPNIDSLAAGGLRFDSFYNTGRCCPTRAALLTGLYPHQSGVGRMTFKTNAPGYRGDLSENCVTIAEVLKPSGYRTAMVGKWHLSLTESNPNHMAQLNRQQPRELFSDPNTYPVGRGFEEHFGIIWGVVNYFDPFSLVHNTTAIEDVPEEFYITDAFNEKAVEYVEKYSSVEQPFFMYLAHCAPHWPLHALPEDIAEYKETYKVGWEKIRQQRYARQQQLGLIDPAITKLSERTNPDLPWDENPDKKWDAAAMACHAAMIDRVDQGIGQLIAKLKELKQFDNTLIFVLSDNGASKETPNKPGFDRTSETRAGETVTYFGGDKPKNVLPGPETTYAGIGPEWANVSNTPLRLYKATQHEGGIRTPLVVHWPEGLKTSPGSITHQPGHVIDLMATCLDVAEADYPGQFNGKTIDPLAGKSLLPILQNKDGERHEAIYFEHFGAKAIRKGDWKLVSLPNGEWELYHLSVDGSETNNLAKENSQKVNELSREWQHWAETNRVYPLPGKPKGKK